MACCFGSRMEDRRVRDSFGRVAKNNFGRAFRESGNKQLQLYLLVPKMLNFQLDTRHSRKGPKHSTKRDGWLRGVQKLRSFFLLSLVGGTTVSYYFTEWKVHHYHVFYQGLYFLPVMLAGFWFALRGGLATSLGITILLLPFTITHWKGFSADDFNSVMELVLYNVVAVILGKLRDQERIVQKRLREAERLAAMGKAVSGLAHELKTPLIAIGGLSRLVRRIP